MIATLVVSVMFSANSSAGVGVEGRIVRGNVGLRDAVISLEGGKKGAPLKGVTIDQRDKRFIPHVTIATPGTSIRFPNSDTVFHNVFAHFQAARFDLGMYPRGAIKNYKFDRPGVVSLFCNVHSEMSAYIVIVDTPFFALTDGSGTFSIKGVEPGEYMLKVWQESGVELSQKVTVKPGMGPINLSAAGK